MSAAWTIMPGADRDTTAILELLARVFAEYDCQLDPVLDRPEHYHPQTCYWDKGGAFFIARDHDAKLIATAAVHAPDPHIGQLRTMYLDRSLRGSGLAQALMHKVVAWCRENHKTHMILWSDTRFTRAHAFYTKLGFIKTGKERALHDINNSSEYHFEAKLDALRL